MRQSEGEGVHFFSHQISCIPPSVFVYLTRQNQALHFPLFLFWPALRQSSHSSLPFEVVDKRGVVWMPA